MSEKKPINPCNDCKIEFRHCPLYPEACKRFDEYVEAMKQPQVNLSGWADF